MYEDDLDIMEQDYTAPTLDDVTQDWRESYESEIDITYPDD